MSFTEYDPNKHYDPDETSHAGVHVGPRVGRGKRLVGPARKRAI